MEHFAAATSMPNSCAPSAVYKGCTPDAPGKHTGFAMLHPVRTPRTPNVHPLYTMLLCLGQSLGWVGRGLAANDAFGRFLAAILIMDEMGQPGEGTWLTRGRFCGGCRPGARLG